MSHRKGILIVSMDPPIAEYGMKAPDVQIKTMSVRDIILHPDPWQLLRGHKFDRIMLPDMLEEEWAAQTADKVKQCVMPTIMHHGSECKERIVYY